MKARDVMVSPVVTVKPYASVKEVARDFSRKHISVVPVIDDGGKLVGIISEGDLMHCPLLEQRILFGTGAEWLGR